MYSVQRHTVEKLVRRELTEDEWRKLQKVEFKDVQNWIRCRACDKKNS